jgi:NAD(P)-dependent dehydrogenase (short-subunit alcohol dehydrogenase family)
MGRHALVIGNSDGIGLALTRRLLGEGWTVTGVSRRAAPIEPTGAYDHSVLDVAAPDYRAALAALQTRRGPLDLCVYCAGIGDDFDAKDLSREAQVFRVNLLGAVETAEVVLPQMISARSGHFVGLSSIADEIRAPDAPSYSASKAGMSSYLAGLALALRRHGVYVTTVRFGFVDTKMAKSPVKPMMATVERAVDVLMRCLRTRPIQVSYPKTMGLLVRLLSWFSSIRIWFS